MTRISESEYIEAISKAIEVANHHMNLDDLDYDADPDNYDDMYEERFHCGTCVVRSVLEIVWPAFNDYIMFLSNDE